ncbi:xanthine dehydrogenase molybdopterin binding subunit [Aestuariibacter sp. AA17]|uniref:Xanthine dehydrogenase molybdopterin binding subunit n=1 Tax=Fluctibacter corallii TaxID=2984329 RepID=A0ABT3A6N6_9ALTE|nr:xanthine dehydrogenase molybdopterin binding subunit [Aestuariibacter sp. AA17]MCV2884229.1 xanthine dehydrogenase molybdopterin binding subunit [Aestuariibacter sp. AA17]
MRKLIDTPLASPVHEKHKPSVHESAIAHVTGQAIYVDDKVEPLDCAYAAIGLTARASGSVKTLDLAAVREAEGVVDVITINDVPGMRDIAPVFDGDPVFVDDKIKFWGQPLFAVLAQTTDLARRAAKLAKVTYEDASPCLDTEVAHKDKRYVRPPLQMVRDGATTQKSAHRVSNTFTIGGQEHLYLEGQVSMAVPDEEGMLIYTSSQHPSEVQKLVAEVLDWPLHKITVDMRRMGGGFGGKETQAAQWACIAAIFAHRQKRAVKLRLPRQTDMMATGKRHPFTNTYAAEIDAKGNILHCDMTLLGNCGHSPDLSDAIVDRAMFHADNAYFYPSANISGYRCQTNMVSHTAFRGFGGPQGMMAAEAMLDDIARKIGADPLSVRKQNLYSADGTDTTHYGMQVENNLLHDIISTLENDCDYWQRRAAISEFNANSPYIKKGLALTPVKFGISFTAKHLNQAGALVHVYTDGSIQVNHGGTEMGQGLHSKIQIIAAREFGVALDAVRVTATRTDKVPNTSPTAASSGTDLNGKAVQNACQIILENLITFLAKKYDTQEENITFDSGYVGVGAHSLPFAEVVQDAYMHRVSLSSTGFYKTPKIHYNRDTGKGRPFFYFAFGAACSEVEIDTLTGENRVTRVDILHDVGTSIHPEIDIGQIEGAFIQGMGWLTTEDLKWDEQGQLISNNPATYKIPAIGDTPSHFKVKLFDRANAEDSIYHSKAVGEPPFMLAISVWCAIRDAIASVSNYQVSPTLNAPATPEEIIRSLRGVSTTQGSGNESS